MKRIAIEEHFYTEGYVSYLRSRKDTPKLVISRDENGNRKETMCWSAPEMDMNQIDFLTEKLLDLDEGRLRDMDENGIDMQVLSLSTPGVEQFGAADGTLQARRVNDELARTVRGHPDRFAGFATLAPQDPEAAAGELERAVKELGFKGAFINSHLGNEYLDNRKYWPVFAQAERLGVPVYLHPTIPSDDMLRPYLPYPDLAFAMWGFGAETGLHAMCLICSGVFDAYPGLKVIIGHLGEALPFWLWRIDNHWKKMRDARISPDSVAGRLRRTPGEYLRDNFLLTTSGMPWPPAMQFVHSVMGADQMLFSTDYPYESAAAMVACIESIDISDGDREKIFHRNAEKYLGL